MGASPRPLQAGSAGEDCDRGRLVLQAARVRGTAMTDVSISPIGHRNVDTCAGRGHAATGLAFWLGLAAAPTFAIMALWSAFFSGQPDTLCIAMQGSSPMSDMTLMYLLMSVFHAAPWLRLIFTSRRTGAW